MRTGLQTDPEERSDDLAGRGGPGGFAARGEGSRDPSRGRAEGTPKKGRLIFVGGGARSGKSSFALALALARGSRRRFIATAEPRDAEMRQRIEAHRQERGDRFETIEVPHALAAALRDSAHYDLVVIDCLTLWLSNRLFAGEGEAAIGRELETVLDAVAGLRGSCIVISNEVGLGLVPDSAIGRAFRDLSGRCHQQLSARADEIYLAALGSVLRLRPGPVELVAPTLSAPAVASVPSEPPEPSR